MIFLDDCLRRIGASILELLRCNILFMIFKNFDNRLNLHLRHSRNLPIQFFVSQNLRTDARLVQLKVDDVLLNRRNIIIRILVHKLAHNHLALLTRTMRPTNRLQFSRRIPRWGHNVHTRCTLKVQPDTTRLDLNQKDGVWWSRLKVGDALFAFMVIDRTIKAKNGKPLLDQNFLQVIRLASKLSKHK